jgi:hypothetical protein
VVAKEKKRPGKISLVEIGNGAPVDERIVNGVFRMEGARWRCAYLCRVAFRTTEQNIGKLRYPQTSIKANRAMRPMP